MISRHKCYELDSSMISCEFPGMHPRKCLRLFQNAHIITWVKYEDWPLTMIYWGLRIQVGIHKVLSFQYPEDRIWRNKGDRTKQVEMYGDFKPSNIKKLSTNSPGTDGMLSKKHQDMSRFVWAKSRLGAIWTLAGYLRFCGTCFSFKKTQHMHEYDYMKQTGIPARLKGRICTPRESRGRIWSTTLSAFQRRNQPFPDLTESL